MTYQIPTTNGKTARSQQRLQKRLGLARPVGRPPAALDSDFDDVYVKVKMRRMTKQEAADQLGCSVRTLERKFKLIKQAQLHALTNSKRQTKARV